MSTRRKKNLPHVHKPGTCFSMENFPTALHFDPFACQTAPPEDAPEPVAASELDQELDEIVEDLAEAVLE